MNDRQKALYDYLLSHKNESRYIPKIEIAMNVGYAWCIGSQRNGRDIEFDVRELNDSEIEHIIVSSKQGYKIATNKDELEEYFNGLKTIFEKKFYRYKALKKKAAKEGFYQVDFEANEIKEYSVIG